MGDYEVSSSFARIGFVEYDVTLPFLNVYTPSSAICPNFCWKTPAITMRWVYEKRNSGVLCYSIPLLRTCRQRNAIILIVALFAKHLWDIFFILPTQEAFAQHAIIELTIVIPKHGVKDVYLIETELQLRPTDVSLSRTSPIMLTAVSYRTTSKKYGINFLESFSI